MEFHQKFVNSERHKQWPFILANYNLLDQLLAISQQSSWHWLILSIRWKIDYKPLILSLPKYYTNSQSFTGG